MGPELDRADSLGSNGEQRPSGIGASIYRGVKKALASALVGWALVVPEKRKQQVSVSRLDNTMKPYDAAPEDYDDADDAPLARRPQSSASSEDLMHGSSSSNGGDDAAEGGEDVGAGAARTRSGTVLKRYGTLKRLENDKDWAVVTGGWCTWFGASRTRFCVSMHGWERACMSLGSVLCTVPGWLWRGLLGWKCIKTGARQLPHGGEGA